jgi:hypothetical protein
VLYENAVHVKTLSVNRRASGLFRIVDGRRRRRRYAIGSGPSAFVVCLMSGRVVVFGRAEQLSAENVFHTKPQEFANVSIQNDEIHENEDAARLVEQVAKLQEIPQSCVQAVFQLEKVGDEFKYPRNSGDEEKFHRHFQTNSKIRISFR